MVRPGVTVMVGIPSFGMVSTYFMQSVAAMQYPLVASKVENVVLNKPIADARNEIVEDALRQGAQYIFWLDDDVVCPGDTFLKLYRHQKDIVNGVYWSKSNPPMPLLFRGHLQGPYWDWHVGDFFEIDAAGNGLTLVNTNVYRKISETVGGPWYSTEYASFPGLAKGGPNNTEDLYFYWKAKRAGFKIWADTSVQGMHYDSSNKVFYTFPPNAPQNTPDWKINPPGTKLIADLGSGPVTPYMFDEGRTVSFDIREELRPDVRCDLRHIPVEDETFDIVFSSHTLEHFPWASVDRVLREWSRILKTGGELRLIVPNLRYVGQRLAEDKVIPTDYWVMYGEQEYPKNFHATGFTPNTLTSLVESLGIYENIMVREGNFDEAPPNCWNLQLKATKVKHGQKQDNIAPPDMVAVPPKPQLWPMRLYDTPTVRDPETLIRGADWLFTKDIEDRFEKILKESKEAVVTKLQIEDDGYETNPIVETIQLMPEPMTPQITPTNPKGFTGNELGLVGSDGDISRAVSAGMHLTPEEFQVISNQPEPIVTSLPVMDTVEPKKKRVRK